MQDNKDEGIRVKRTLASRAAFGRVAVDAVVNIIFLVFRSEDR
jgi:hypothetical protein